MANSEELARLIVKMEVEMAEYHAALKTATSGLRTFERKATGQLSSIKKQFRSFGNDVRSIMGLFGVGFALRGVVNFSQSIVRAGDEIALMSKRLETFSGDSDAFRKARESADLLGVSVKDVADGMTRLLVVGKSVGITSDMAQKLTTTFQQLGRIGGASGEEASRAFIQLTQGIGKGVLQGQDLKAVMSDVP
jgi:phage tail tape-measure protein